MATDELPVENVLWKPVRFVSSSTSLATIDIPDDKEIEGNDIAAFYRSIVNPDHDESSSASQSNSNPAESNSLTWCNVCRRKVGEYDRHILGTAHLVNSKSYKPVDALVLNATNVGYRLLESQGWDTDEGLGVHGQGRRHPIATTLKPDRQCLGAANAPKKAVTHRYEDIERARQKKRISPKKNYLSGKAIAEREKADSRQRVRMLKYMND